MTGNDVTRVCRDSKKRLCSASSSWPSQAKLSDLCRISTEGSGYEMSQLEQKSLCSCRALSSSFSQIRTPPKPKKHAAKGRLQLVFEQVAKLPRRQQQKVIEMAEGFLALHKGANGKAT